MSITSITSRQSLVCKSKLAWDGLGTEGLQRCVLPTQNLWQYRPLTGRDIPYDAAHHKSKGYTGDEAERLGMGTYTASQVQWN